MKASPTTPGRASATPGLAEIQSLEEALHCREVRHNKDAVDNLLAEEFVEFGASGNVYDRGMILSSLTQEEEDVDNKLIASNYVLTPISDDAMLLTYQTYESFKDGSARHVLRSSIWKYVDAKWQMAFHQGTISHP